MWPSNRGMFQQWPFFLWFRLAERASHMVMVILVVHVSHHVPEAPELQARGLANHGSQKGSAERSLDVASLLQLLLGVLVSTCKTVVCK